jgi:hypothetical protein
MSLHIYKFHVEELWATQKRIFGTPKLKDLPYTYSFGRMEQEVRIYNSIKSYFIPP